MSSEFLAWKNSIETFVSRFEDVITSTTELYTSDPTKELPWVVLESEIANLITDVREVEASMDATNVESLELYNDGVQVLHRLFAQRNARKVLCELKSEVLDLKDNIEDLASKKVKTSYLVKAGDTWQDIANVFYENHKLWPVIAEANGMSVGDLVAGLTLIIPEI